MTDDDLLDKAQGLSDLELACLLCLMSREHCIISSAPTGLDDLLQELQYVRAQLVFVLNPDLPSTR